MNMQRLLRTTHLHRKIKLKDIEKSCGCMMVGARRQASTSESGAPGQASTSESGAPGQASESGEPKILPYISNRNPRNLEMLRIERKCGGYAMDVQKRSWWNKVVFATSGTHTTGSVLHHTNGIIVSASTKEWCIRQHLYSGRDVSAAENIGRVLAHRCLMSGLDNLFVDFTEEERQREKITLFLSALEGGGVELTELPEFGTPGTWGRGGDTKKYHNTHLLHDIDEEGCDYTTPVSPLTIPHDDEPVSDEFYNLARLGFFERDNDEFVTEENTGVLKHLRKQHKENKTKLK